MTVDKSRYIEQTTIIDPVTGEVLDEQTSRLNRRYYQIRRAELRASQREAGRRPALAREARDLLIAGALVLLMGIVLWAMAHISTYPAS